MVDYDTFVASLGPDAERYTPAQLQQLHVDVQRLASVLLAIHNAGSLTNPPLDSPQVTVDDAYHDRTLDKTATGHDREPGPRQVPER